MSRIIVFAACAVLLAGCAASEPQGPSHLAGGPPHAGRHGESGENGDGQGLRTLFISPCGEPFRGRAGDPYPSAAWFAQADANHDGKLDQAEFVADAMRFFARLDQDGDGVIDAMELRAYEHQMVPEILGGRGGPGEFGALSQAPRLILAQMGGGGGHGGGGGRHGGAPEGSAPRPQGVMTGAAPYTFLAEPEPVAASDLSFSGQIKRKDFQRRAEQRFEALDPDQRGYLLLAELPETQAQKMQGGRPGRRGPPPRPA